MKLSELFPDMPSIVLNGKQYELIYNTRAMLQLEKDYPDQIIDDKEINSADRILKILNSMFTGMKTTDLVNFLHAGLLHTKAFSKESLIDAMSTHYFNIYIENIFTAYTLSKSTPEQKEKMEVMAAANGSKKKMDQEITVESTHITALNAD